MLKIFELLKNTKNLIIFALTCMIICFVGKYRDFDFVEIGTFKLSFDFMFFIALVGATVSSIILIWKVCGVVFSWINGLLLLHTIKNCSSEEKDFLYNRVYENGNELQIDMNSDAYFYKQDERTTTYHLVCYKRVFDTKSKVIKFLRQLEKKKIIKNFGNQHMIIPERVWDILIKNANEIFKDFNPLPIEPTEDKIKWAKILYNTVYKEHKDILKKIMLSPSSEYTNIKVLSSELASQANLLKIYPLFNEFQVDFLTNACIATFSPDLYFILDSVLKEDTNEK